MNPDLPIWFRMIEPAHEIVGGIAQTSCCLVCGAAVTVTQSDTTPAVIHIDWHTQRGESP